MNERPLMQGFLLGLTMGTTCLATCGPIYGPFLMQRARGLRAGLGALIQIFFGRFVAYSAFGAAAGFLGAETALLHRSMFTVVAYGLSAGFLLLSAFSSFRLERSCVASHWAVRIADRPFLLGAITGINVCPSFLVALTRAAVTGGASAGMLFFVFFFLGTSIYMLPISALGLIAEKRVFRFIGCIASLAVAGWLIYGAVAILLARNSIRGL